MPRSPDTRDGSGPRALDDLPRDVNESTNVSVQQSQGIARFRRRNTSHRKPDFLDLRRHTDIHDFPRRGTVARSVGLFDDIIQILECR